MDGQGFSVANDKAGLKALITRLKRLGSVAVGLEPSGGYEARALKALSHAGVAVYRLDAAQVRSFARGLGRRAKPVLGRAQARPGGPTPWTRR